MCCNRARAMTSMLKVKAYVDLDPFDAMNHRVVHCPILHGQSAEIKKKEKNESVSLIFLLLSLGG